MSRGIEALDRQNKSRNLRALEENVKECENGRLDLEQNSRNLALFSGRT